jgi:MOSC domain-containing protein YiiM
MVARIEQLSVGRPQLISHDGKEVSTAIFKYPVADRAAVSLTNVDGDRQADLTVHGGRDKAVYVYPAKHYATWAQELGVESLEPAQFGENLTVSGLDESTVTIGSRYRFGSTTALVAQPRLPCFKLGIRMNDHRFPQRFLASGRLGFYLRVEQEGDVGAGDAFELVEQPTHDITVQGLWQIVFGGGTPDEAGRALELLPHLDVGWMRRLRMLAGQAGQAKS